MIVFSGSEDNLSVGDVLFDVRYSHEKLAGVCVCVLLVQLQ